MAGRAPSRRLVIFALFSAAYFLSQFFRSANAVIAPDLSQELSIGAAQLGLMTSLFYAAFAAVQLPLGQALDRFGARVVTPSLMLVGAGGSLLFGAGHSFAVLALGRALIGMGMAGV
ncbi:MAG: MFS transporter, partial [Thermoleophilia bacterium]|nr:MFS transporter [Thermoleophilia bacterium]